MRIFIDTEFIDRGPRFPISLISLGAVKDNGQTFYAVSSEFDPSTAHPWVKKNVLPRLRITDDRLTLREIASKFERWVALDPTPPEFWAYYSSFDWVIICQMFDGMNNLPRTWPSFCWDLKQWCMDLGNPVLPKADLIDHHALHDAMWARDAFKFLQKRAQTHP